MAKNNWFEGAEGEWQRIKEIYARLADASEANDIRTTRLLQRSLLRVFHCGLKKVKYKGRLLGALGDCTLVPKQQLRTLLLSYSKSKQERDFYNCLLVADSLAEFYVETRFNSSKAVFWIKKTKSLLKRYNDKFRSDHIRLLTRQLAQRKGVSPEWRLDKGMAR